MGKSRVPRKTLVAPALAGACSASGNAFMLPLRPGLRQPCRWRRFYYCLAHGVFFGFARLSPTDPCGTDKESSAIALVFTLFDCRACDGVFPWGRSSARTSVGSQTFLGVVRALA